MSRDVRAIVAQIILAVILALGLSGCVQARTLAPSSETPQLVGSPQPAKSYQEKMPSPTWTRQIAENTIGLREHWRISQGWIGDLRSASMQAIPGRIAYCEAYTSVLHRLRVLDATSGELLWEAPEGWDCGLVAADTERVYLVVDAGVGLRTYDLGEGRLLWEHTLKRKVFYMYSDGEKLHVYLYNAEPGKEIYRFDARTGDYSTDAQPGYGFVWAQWPSFILYDDSHNVLRAVDVATQQVLWVVSITAGSRQPVTLSNGVLLVGAYDRLFVIDAQTGQIKWEDSPFASNAVGMGGSAYVLNCNARLVRMDLQTGQETGYVQFTPASVDPSHHEYVIATDGRMLFMHFSDSQELIALGP